MGANDETGPPVTAGNPWVPRGIIAAWYGEIPDIPSGWALCDGQNGTPDLRDKFIIGAGISWAPLATGGSETHDHGGVTFSGPNNTEGAIRGSDFRAADDTHIHNIDTASNLPPLCALAYIMKL